MPTRSDFYIGKGRFAQWIGSAGMDGDPKSVASDMRIMPEYAITITTVDDWHESVLDLLRDHHPEHTLPEQGWPWPWKDSNTTDFAYTFFESKVWVSCYGCEWRTLEQWLTEDPEAKEAIDMLPTGTLEFPSMIEIQNVRWDPGNAPMVPGP